MNLVDKIFFRKKKTDNKNTSSIESEESSSLEETGKENRLKSKETEIFTKFKEGREKIYQHPIGSDFDYPLKKEVDQLIIQLKISNEELKKDHENFQKVRPDKNVSESDILLGYNKTVLPFFFDTLLLFEKNMKELSFYGKEIEKEIKKEIPKCQKELEEITKNSIHHKYYKKDIEELKSLVENMVDGPLEKIRAEIQKSKELITQFRVELTKESQPNFLQNTLSHLRDTYKKSTCSISSSSSSSLSSLDSSNETQRVEPFKETQKSTSLSPLSLSNETQRVKPLNKVKKNRSNTEKSIQ